MKIDAPRDYQSYRAALRAALADMASGEELIGAGWGEPGVVLAVKEFLPFADVRIVGERWAWFKGPSAAGHWVVEADPADFLLFIPHRCNDAVLAEALASVAPYRARVVVIDQSQNGLPAAVWDGPTVRWDAEPNVGRVFNWMQQETLRRGFPFYLFMHSDATAGPDSVRLLIQAARAQAGEWAAVFTHYDALACMNALNPQRAGCWDESFRWYVSDVDYYNRLRWEELEIVNLGDVGVRHRGSATLKALPEEERRAVDADSIWARDHYRHKWGCECGVDSARRTWTVPYDGRP